MAEKYIEEIYSHNNIPIFVGGTGLYVNSILYDFKFTYELLKYVEKKGKNPFVNF